MHDRYHMRALDISDAETVYEWVCSGSPDWKGDFYPGPNKPASIEVSIPMEELHDVRHPLQDHVVTPAGVKVLGQRYDATRDAYIFHVEMVVAKPAEHIELEQDVLDSAMRFAEDLERETAELLEQMPEPAPPAAPEPAPQQPAPAPAEPHQLRFARGATRSSSR